MQKIQKRKHIYLFCKVEFAKWCPIPLSNLVHSFGEVIAISY